MDAPKKEKIQVWLKRDNVYLRAVKLAIFYCTIIFLVVTIILLIIYFAIPQNSYFQEQSIDLSPNQFLIQINLLLLFQFVIILFSTICFQVHLMEILHFLLPMLHLSII